SGDDTLGRMTLVRHYRCWIAVCVIGAILASWWISSAQLATGPSKENYDRIKIGMSPQEVRGIIGQLPASDRVVMTFLAQASREGQWEQTQCEQGPKKWTLETASQWWLGTNVAIEVDYSAGKVIQKSLSVRRWLWHPKVRGWLGTSAQCHIQMCRFEEKRIGMEIKELRAQSE